MRDGGVTLYRSSILNHLLALGWNSQLASEHTQNTPALQPARVIAVDRNRCLVAKTLSSLDQPTSVSIAGRLRHEHLDDIAVGDWVGLHGDRIDYVFARHSCLQRKRVGESSAEQVIAANIDFTLIAMSLNDDFSPRRVERFVVAAWDAGTTPVVLLTKCDLVTDTGEAVRSLVEAAAGCDIITTSALTGEGIDSVRGLVCPGQTAVLLGSSGVGKSTLINALLGGDVQTTAEIREADSKGRHTTTRRELLQIPNGGGLFIDTPGIREFGVLHSSNDNDGFSLGFADIHDLAEDCGYRDCSHATEPNCAVLEAIEYGDISQSRLDSYFKLQRELAYNEGRHDASKRRQEGKDLSKLIRRHVKHKREQ